MRRLWMMCFVLLAGMAWNLEPVSGQERGGTISGTVTDAGPYVLPGARVDLEPKGPTAVSDQQGRFTIQNVPPGDYVITVSYVGLLPFTERLTVGAGQVIRVEAVL